MCMCMCCAWRAAVPGRNPQRYAVKRLPCLHDHCLSGLCCGLTPVLILCCQTMTQIVPTWCRDGFMLSIAIELTDSAAAEASVVYTPANTKPGLWRLVKAVFNSLDSMFHQTYSHFVRAHASTEPYILATHRQLSAMHPVSRQSQAGWAMLCHCQIGLRCIEMQAAICDTNACCFVHTHLPGLMEAVLSMAGAGILDLYMRKWPLQLLHMCKTMQLPVIQRGLVCDGCTCVGW